MVTKILTSGLIAGAAAGAIGALLQLVFVQPVLLHAELYETGALIHFGAASDVSAHPDLGGYQPVRDGLSIIFTMMIYAGYSLVLVALMSVAELRGARIDARTGLLWGLAGFFVVQFAPAFSLPPETPGVAAADVYVRQIWWFATVFTAGLAVWLIAFGKGIPAWGAAAALLVAPHLVGAPEPEVFAGTAPTELGALFSSRALGVGAAAWLMLGLFAGALWSWESDAPTVEQRV